MSKSADFAKSTAAAAIRWQRLELTLQQMLTVAKLRREGLPMEAIATRLGWTVRTLERWFQAAKVLERKGLKMSQSSTHP